MAEDVVTNGLFGSLAGFLGTTEPALRLLVSIFFGYPLALFHRQYLYGKKGLIQHLYFIISGLFIGYFNYGLDVLHPISAIFYTYLITSFIKGPLLALQISFVVNFSHLLIGYYFTGTDDYDIKWTMPHCVLVLRLIGYSFNIYDGTKRDEELSSENKNTCLKESPHFIKYCGFMFFPASFLVGPQFSYKRYKNFTKGKYNDSNNSEDKPNCVDPALKRLVTGLVYLMLFQFGSSYFNETYMLSKEFSDISFIRRLFYVAFWARFQLYKYISCWLLTEGALIMFSLSHNGKDENNDTLWNGCENVKLKLFESTTQFNHYIQSFNINTNQWVAQYIYKRLKFLGNRHLSQVAALLFLAIWHGFHSGYYVCFFMEFSVMFFEKDLQSLLSKHENVTKFLWQEPVSMILHLILRLYTFLFMGWCLTPFVLLKCSKYWKVFHDLNYIGFIFFLPWALVYKPLVKIILKSTSKKDKTDKQKDKPAEKVE